MCKFDHIDEPGQSISESARSIARASFDRCLVDGDLATQTRGRRTRRRALGISIAIEALLVGLVIVAPLMTSVAEPHWARDVYIPFAPGSPIRSRPIARALHSGPSSNPITITFIPPMYVGPVASRTNDSAEPNIEVSFGARDIAPPAFLDLHFARPSPPPEEGKAPSEKKPLKLSEGVEQAQLISRIEPRYPWLALQTRVQGTVRLHAIISREGTIASLEVVSGQSLLAQAALEAVRQWRYRPTMLDGEPVEVETTISVIFQLHN